MSNFTVIIFSGNRVNASFATNRIAKDNAENIAWGLAADDRGVRLDCEGMWDGNGEPSHLVAFETYKNGPDMALGIMRMFQQDAVIYGDVFIPVNITEELLLEALPTMTFTLAYSNGSKAKSTGARLLPASECADIEAWTKIGDLGLVIDFE